MIRSIFSKLKIKYRVRMYNYKNCAEKFPARAQDKKTPTMEQKVPIAKKEKKAINSHYPPTTTNHSFYAS